MTASNRDLEEEVEEKRFRQDLFYRINVVRIVVPALRDRDRDVLELARYFLDRDGARTGRPAPPMSAEVANRLMDYRWPGETPEAELDVVGATRAFGVIHLLLPELAAARGVPVSPAEQVTIASHVNAVIARAAATRVRCQGEDAWRTAHQLRNPLGSAMLALTLLRSRVEFGGYDRLVDTLERNLRRLEDLIEQSAARRRRSSGGATPDG